MPQQPRSILSIRNVSKRFGATQALSNVSFDIRDHEVLALLGANGAGKSTIIKILAKIYTTDSGEITGPNNSSIDEIRFAFIHQDLGLVEWMSVGESVALGFAYPRRNGLISWSGVRHMAEEALKSVAPHINVNELISGLSRADRSLVAIARALYAESDVLVLDEPTASLPAEDCEQLFGVLRKLRENGVAIVYVSHRLDEIFKVADRVIVLRDGFVVEDGPISSFDPSSLVRAIVGRETTSFNLGEFILGDPLLQVENLSGENVRTATFSMNEGEVLGLIGLNGAGHREVGRMIAGAMPYFGGSISLKGKGVVGNISEIVMQGISLITSSRAEEGLAMGLTVRENILPNLRVRGLKPFSWIRTKKELIETNGLTKKFNVKPRDAELAIATLSGGNQQKVILSRWLSMPRSLIVLEEPTAGVDVGAKGDIYRLIHETTQNNLSVLLVSTDFEEVALMAHRALVFSDGEIVAELKRHEISVENLVTYASRANVSTH
jgi:ribose transport system ATP-binding protein